MHGFISVIAFTMMICSTVPYDRIHNRSNKNHRHDHDHEHRAKQQGNPIWHSLLRAERSPHSTRPSITTSEHRTFKPLVFNITLVPYPLTKNCTWKVPHDPDPVESNWRHIKADLGSNSNLDSNDSKFINISVIHEIFFGNITGNEFVGDNSQMIYPDDNSHQIKRQIVSRNCTFGLCEDVENYPVEKVNSLITRSKELKQYFQHMDIPSSIGTRFGEDGDPLCSTVTHTVFPKSAKNVKDVEMILVNVGDFKQGVVFETCANKGKQCSYTEGFPMGITTTCIQKYTVRRLMAVTKESDEPIFDNFPLPSCCVCTFKKNS